MIRNHNKTFRSHIQAGELTPPLYLTTEKGLLFQGDCLKLLPCINDNSIDLVFADPPFNLGKQYGSSNFNDFLQDEKYLEWCYDWIDECIRVLKDTGSIFIYNLPKWLMPLGVHLSRKMKFRHWIALTMKNTYPRGKRLYPAHYGLLFFSKSDDFTFHKLRVPVPLCRHCKKELRDYGGHRSKLNPLGLNLTDFWEDTSPVRHSKFKKRAANELKPIIPRRAILMASNEHDIILDPFGGSGSTYAEAERANRFWIGCETEDCSPIADRLADLPVIIGINPHAKVRNVFKSNPIQGTAPKNKRLQSICNL